MILYGVTTREITIIIIIIIMCLRFMLTFIIIIMVLYGVITREVTIIIVIIIMCLHLMLTFIIITMILYGVITREVTEAHIPTATGARESGPTRNHHQHDLFHQIIIFVIIFIASIISRNISIRHI